MNGFKSAEVTKPLRLKRGDRVAVVSPSWGGPHAFPHVLDLGIRNLESEFGIQMVEFPTARMANDELYRNPKIRAKDINDAFADPSISAIFASIGGDDSVRVLPYLDLELITANPKIFMGFSDTTTFTSLLNWHGLVTYNGPSLLAGFAQMRHSPRAFTDHIRDVLFDAKPVTYRPFEEWTNNYVDWHTPGYDGERGQLSPHDGWRWLQGSGLVQGPLFGGCIEVLEFLKGTEFWPSLEFFNGKLLFLETSEEKPPVSQVKYWMRNFGSMGVLERLGGILFGRARSYTDDEKRELDEMLVRVATVEFNRPDLPIVANLDFGHCDPQWILPLGCLAEIDCDRKIFKLSEPAVA